jgi:hypothetical protein
VHKECELVWLACALDSEGSLGILIIGPTERCVHQHVVARFVISNTNQDYLLQALEIIEGLGIRWWAHERKKFTSKPLYDIGIGSMEGIFEVLKKITPHLIVKHDFAVAIIGLLSRHMRRINSMSKRSWNGDDIDTAKAIRRRFMPNSKCANEGPLTDSIRGREAYLLEKAIAAGEEVLSATTSEASGSAISTEELLETRSDRSATDDPTHERPASHVDEEIVRSGGDTGGEDKEPRQDITRN